MKYVNCPECGHKLMEGEECNNVQVKCTKCGAILWAIDEERGEVCEAAKDAEIPVIAFGKLVKNTDAITYYIGFDYRGFGRQQGEYIKEKLGLDENNESYNIEIFTNNEDIEVIEIFEGIMEILQPYFDSGALMGEVHNVTPLDYGVKENAKMYMMNLVDEKSYTPSNMSLNVVCCCVDKFARGIIEALTDVGFTSDTMPIITSFGGSTETWHNIKSGLQSMTVTIDYKGLSERAVEVADNIICGIEPDSEGSVDNGSGEIATGSIPGEFYDQHSELPPDDEEKILERIEVTKEPARMRYLRYEQFDVYGMVVTAYYEDGSSRRISNYYLKIVPEILESKGSSVTVDLY